MHGDLIYEIFELEFLKTIITHSVFHLGIQISSGKNYTIYSLNKNLKYRGI